MNIRTAIQASALCLLPALVGFSAGALAVEHPRLFLAALVVSAVTGGVQIARSYLRAGRGGGGNGLEQVDVAAGACLASSFMAAFASGLCVAAGRGLPTSTLAIAILLGLLASTCITVVRRLVGEFSQRDRLLTDAQMQGEQGQ